MLKVLCVLPIIRLLKTKFPIYNYNVANEPMLRDSGYGTVTYVYDNRYKQNYYAVNVYTDYSHSFGKT